MLKAVNMQAWCLWNTSHGPTSQQKQCLVYVAQTALKYAKTLTICKYNLHNLHDATLVIATGVNLHVVLHAFFDFAIRCSMCVGTADMTHMLSSLGARPPKRPD